MGTSLKFTWGGVEQINRTILGFKSRMLDLTPVWDDIHLVFLRWEEELFQTQGASGGHGRWAGYDSEPRYAGMKRALVGNDWDRVLIWRNRAESRLWPSLTMEGHPDHLFFSSPQKVEIGTRMPYADRLAQGGRGPKGEPFPGRMAVDLNEQNRKDVTKILQRYLVAQR